MYSFTNIQYLLSILYAVSLYLLLYLLFMYIIYIYHIYIHIYIYIYIYIYMYMYICLFSYSFSTLFSRFIYLFFSIFCCIPIFYWLFDNSLLGLLRGISFISILHFMYIHSFIICYLHSYYYYHYFIIINIILFAILISYCFYFLVYSFCN